MSVTKIWKDPERGDYLVVSHEKVWEKFGIDFKFIDNNGKEKKLEPIGKFYNVQRPLNQGHPLYLSNTDLLRALLVSGVKEEEIEKLKSKL
jgi:hypothetical protein